MLTRGSVHYLREIERMQGLPDAPLYMFSIQTESEVQNLQTSHTPSEELIPLMGSTLWRYLHTTREEIPVFVYAGQMPIDQWVTKAPNGLWYPRDAVPQWARERGC